jgi:hypothetical protein
VERFVVVDQACLNTITHQYWFVVGETVTVC